MEIIKDFPPNYALLKQVFKITDKVLFCYGDKIYNPNNLYVDPIVIAHEEVHSKQQGDEPDKWWQRYIVDSAFRWTQELEAYQKQFLEIKKKFKDRNKQTEFLYILANDLSSPTYGGVCSIQEALMAIRDNIKFKV